MCVGCIQMSCEATTGGYNDLSLTQKAPLVYVLAQR